GVDVKVIAEWQGHKDGGKLILDTYSHVNRAHSQRMAQLMNTSEPENVLPFMSKTEFAALKGDIARGEVTIGEIRPNPARSNAASE
ncbi:MAG: hypothetical protein H0V54_09880, partial [Chthoniobacterales bacterium]|nr:hypothetical protein [Chthoniobacterales bacterium]